MSSRSAGPGDAANKSGAQQSGQANYTDIQAALGFIPADDRDTWIRVGMAIRSELGVGGFQLFDDWSKKSPEVYNEKDTMDAWKSFNGSGVGIGTLFGIAKEHGYKPARPSLSIEDQWNGATSATDHPYLSQKGVKAHGLRHQGEILFIPFRDVEGVFHGFQRIFKENGKWEKKHAYGAKVRGHFHTLGDLSGSYVALVAEGYATAAAIHEATDYPVIVAFDSGNLEHVCKAVKAKHPDKTIIVCGDDDAHLKQNVGREKAIKAARAVCGITIFPQFEKPAERGRNDFNDLLRESGADSVRDQIEAGLNLRTEAGQDEVVRDCPALPADYIAVDGLENQQFTKTWVVDGLLEEGRAYQVFGEWKSGKTLAALDLCAHMSLGQEWAGRRTVPALIIWVASESCDDVKRRIAAWRLNHQMTGKMPFFIRTKPLHLDVPEFAAQLAAEIQTIRDMNPGLPVVTVIDTVARSLSAGADENGEGLRGFANLMLDEVVRPLNVTALFVHHSGHGNKDRARGSSAFPAALDGTIKVSMDKSVTGTFVNVEAVEMRSTAGTDSFRFRVDTQEIHGSDNFGNVMTEPVLFFTGEAAKKSTREKRPTKGAVEALELLKGMTERYRENLAASGKDDEPRVLHDDWRKQFFDSMGSAKPGTKRTYFMRAKDSLKESGEIYIEGAFVYLGDGRHKTSQNVTKSQNVTPGQGESVTKRHNTLRGVTECDAQSPPYCDDERLPIDDEEYWAHMASGSFSGEYQEFEERHTTSQDEFVTPCDGQFEQVTWDTLSGMLLQKFGERLESIDDIRHGSIEREVAPYPEGNPEMMRRLREINGKQAAGQTLRSSEMIFLQAIELCRQEDCQHGGQVIDGESWHTGAGHESPVR